MTNKKIVLKSKIQGGEDVNKSKKVIIVVSSILIITALIAVFFSFSNKHIKDQKAKAYLYSKYKISIQELKLKKYTPSKYYIDNSQLFPVIKRKEPLWFYDYNGTEIHVTEEIIYGKKYGKHYFDDYQLEEISHMAAKYLSERFDEEIYYVDIDYEFINVNAQEGTKITEEQIPEILKRYFYPIRIYIYSDNPSKDAKNFSSKKIKHELFELIKEDKWIEVYIIDDTIAQERHYSFNNDPLFDSRYSVSIDIIKQADNEHIVRAPYE